MAGLYQRLSATISEADIQSMEYHMANTILEHNKEVAEMSIAEVASLCSVSKSTLSKFVRMLGFEDYKDFKAEVLRHREKEIYIKGIDTINITDYIIKKGSDKYVETLFRDIKETVDNFDDKKFDELIDDLYEYKNIGTFGDFYSEAAAINLQYKMSFYHKKLYTTTNDRKQAYFIENAKEDTLIIVFSNSGRYITNYYNLEGHPQKKCFNKTTAKVVLLTSNKEMEKDPRVDLCIYWKYNENVQNHPFIYQMIIEHIAVCYQKKYGFPEGLI